MFPSVAMAPLSTELSGQKPRSPLWLLTLSLRPHIQALSQVLSPLPLKWSFNLTTLPFISTPFDPGHHLLPGLLEQPVFPAATLKTNQSTSLPCSEPPKVSHLSPNLSHHLLPSLTWCQPHWCFSSSDTLSSFPSPGL